MKFSFVLFTFIFTLFCYKINAQISLPISSYTKIGLGEFNFSENTSTVGMGGLSTIYQSPLGNEVNFFNPAANSNLTETAFNVSGSYNYLIFKNSLANSTDGQSNFNQISLGFPINDKVKAGIGFRGNSFLTNEMVSVDNSDTKNGGLNSLQSFVSYSVNKKLSLGFRAEYQYGNFVSEQSKREFNVKEDSITVKPLTNDSVVANLVRKNISTSDKVTDRLRQAIFTLGAFYKIPLKKKTSFLMGTTIGMGTQISRDIENTLQNTTNYFASEVTYVNGVATSAKSINETTLGYTDENTTTTSPKTKTNINPMQNFSFSIGYEKEEKWMIGTDFQWNKTGVYGNLFDTNIIYQDSYSIALGGWWLPNKNSYKYYFERVIYRAGLFFQQTPYLVDNQNIKDIGASFGMGLPVGKKTKSMINLGFEYINRGTNTGLATKMDYFGVRLGFNLNGEWFSKKLID